MPVYSNKNTQQISSSVVLSLNLLETFANTNAKLHPTRIQTDSPSIRGQLWKERSRLSAKGRLITK